MLKKYFWQSDCLSNLVILYSLCILDSSFLYLIITVRWGYLISMLIVLFSFFSGVQIFRIFNGIFAIEFSSWLTILETGGKSELTML